MTNVLVEGGSRLLRTLFDADLVDEVHAFTAPKIAGGDTVPAPAFDRLRLVEVVVADLDGDEYVRARVDR
jgi:diaminohydroxyphosphoribosylaminopyrimidine deaminase/5-amino-6-(5-phosphoribosylamino)uracil reductase